MTAIALVINVASTVIFGLHINGKSDVTLFMFGFTFAMNFFILLYGYFKWFSQGSLELLQRADSVVKRQNKIIKKLWRLRNV